jgi:hypothetical protein
VKWQNANIDASMGKEIDIPGLFIENPTEEDLRFSEILVKEIPENVPAIPYPLGINLKDAGNCLIDRLRLSDLLHASFRLLPDPLIPVDIVNGTVELTERINLFHLQSEYHIVFSADQTVDLNGRTIQRTKGYGTVHHELHITGTAGFLTRSRDLFGYIRTIHQDLRHGNTVVGQEYDL